MCPTVMRHPHNLNISTSHSFQEKAIKNEPAFAICCVVVFSKLNSAAYTECDIWQPKKHNHWFHLGRA